MAAKDFELILRVQADLQTAVGELRALNDQMRVVKSSAVEASGGLQSLTSAASKTEAGVRGISTQLKSFGSSASSIGGQLRTLAGAVGALVAIREIASFVQNVIAADQALGDMAQKVGVSTEALSALGDVAKRNGSDLQGVQQAFVFLARAGTGLNQTGVRALQAMNINLQKFRDLSPERQFDLVAQKFAGYSDGANKAALATALFGKSGADLIPTLNQVGQQGLQALTDKAIATGTAVGHDAVEAAQKYSDALDDLKKKLRGAVNDGLVQFTPEIEHLSSLLDDPAFLKNLAATAEGIVAIGKGVAEATAALVNFIGTAQGILGFGLDQHVSGDQSYLMAINKLSELQAQQQARKNGTIKLTSSDLTLGFGETTPAFLSDADLAKQIAKLESETAAYRKQSAAADKLAADKKALAEANADPALHVSQAGGVPAPLLPDSDAANKAKQLTEQAAKAQDDLTQALIALQGQLDPTAAIYAKYNDTVKKANDEAALAKQAAGANAQAIDAQRDAVVQLAGSVRDAALDALAEKDRQAWEALRRSFETPAQVAVDDALTKISQLNDLLKKGVISSAEYHDALDKIGAASVTKAPQYQGPDAAVGGAFGELQKNSKALADLEAWHESVLAANASFHAKSAGEEEAYQTRMKTIEQTYSTQRVEIEKARGMLTLQASEEAFGQLAALTSSSNRTLAAIGRAAAIVQAGLSLAINVAKASEVGFPLNLGFIAGAIAQGAEIVELISRAGAGGGGSYAGGGQVRGPGTPTSDSIPVLVSDTEYIHNAAAVRHYGVPFMDAINRRMVPRFADGGLVNPLANAPSPAAMGFVAPTALPVGSITAAAAGNNASGANAKFQDVKVVVLMDKNEVAEELLNSPVGQKVIVKTVGNNPRAIKANWGS